MCSHIYLISCHDLMISLISLISWSTVRVTIYLCLLVCDLAVTHTKDPQLAKLFLGVVNFRLGRYLTAKKLFTQAIALQREPHTSHYKLDDDVIAYFNRWGGWARKQQLMHYLLTLLFFCSVSFALLYHPLKYTRSLI